MKHQRILKVIQKNPNATQIEIARAVGMSERSVRNAISELKEDGVLERVGGDRYGHWELKLGVAKGSGDSTRQDDKGAKGSGDSTRQDDKGAKGATVNAEAAKAAKAADGQLKIAIMKQAIKRGGAKQATEHPTRQDDKGAKGATVNAEAAKAAKPADGQPQKRLEKWEITAMKRAAKREERKYDPIVTCFKQGVKWPTK